MARALAVSAWSNCGHYRLRDERVLHWRAEEALADKSDRRPSRNCNDAAGDGHLFCHQSNNAPRSPPVLRDCILDRLFRQLDHHRTLASVQKPAGASLNTFDASGKISKYANSIGE